MWGLPLSTFLALVVTDASVILAIAWALYDRWKDRPARPAVSKGEAGPTLPPAEH